MKPCLIIHGGFFSESATNAETRVRKQESLRRIVREGYDFLQQNSSFDTVVYAVKMLEDDELFNAGKGSQIQSDGHIRTSAAVMHGRNARFSGVMNLEFIKNPILVAGRLQDYNDRVLAGEGALKFAKGHHFEEANLEIPMRREEYEKKVAALGLGTVGCVAMDSNGVICAATSTGGKGFEIPGRVSDSATVAGNYANEFCGVSCTGVGEDIVSVAMAAKIVTRVTDGLPMDQAFQKTFEELRKIDGYAGAVAIDYQGNIYYRESHLRIVFASYDGETLTVFE